MQEYGAFSIGNDLKAMTRGYRQLADPPYGNETAYGDHWQPPPVYDCLSAMRTGYRLSAMTPGNAICK